MCPWTRPIRCSGCTTWRSTPRCTLLVTEQSLAAPWQDLAVPKLLLDQAQS